MDQPNLPRHVVERIERRWAAVLSHQTALRPKRDRLERAVPIWLLTVNAGTDAESAALICNDRGNMRREHEITGPIAVLCHQPTLTLVTGGRPTIQTTRQWRIAGPGLTPGPASSSLGANPRRSLMHEP
jgi:hypothetical protein